MCILSVFLQHIFSVFLVAYIVEKRTTFTSLGVVKKLVSRVTLAGVADLFIDADVITHLDAR